MIIVTMMMMMMLKKHLDGIRLCHSNRAYGPLWYVVYRKRAEKKTIIIYTANRDRIACSDTRIYNSVLDE